MDGDEIKFSESLADKKIINSSLEELKSVLKFVMIKIGLRAADWPSDEEKAVLIDHILKEFGGHTCQEVRLAFEMAIAGKLSTYDLKGNKVTVNPNCFANFSCLYFSEIMNAYREWAEDVYKFTSRLKSNSLVGIENKKELTDADMENWVNETKEVFNTESKIILIPLEIYDWLLNKKRLQLTKDKRDQYLAMAISIRHDQLVSDAGSGRKECIDDLENFNLMKKEGVFKDKEPDFIKNIAKKVSVFYYLQNIDE